MEAHPSSLLFPILAFPFAGAALNGVAGARIQRALGKRAVHGLAILMPAIAAILAWTAFFQLLALPAEARALTQIGWDFLQIGAVDARVALWLDPLSAVMALIITTIGTLIHVYAAGYMADEPAYWRFFSYLNLFVGMMLVLVLGDGFLVMFIGWEGVGLASYLLIGFWYEELANAAAGMKAFVVNRCGDACFVIGVCALFWGIVGTWPPPATTSPAAVVAGAGRRGATAAPPGDLSAADVHCPVDAASERPRWGIEVAGRPSAPSCLPGSLTFARIEAILGDPARRAALLASQIFGLPLLSFACLCLFLGATAKSAQIPFYVWLPDAMAGPTPVSALIHAATMVTAGIYVIARLSFLYALTPGVSALIAATGAATALFAASIGLFQYDIKKVLAYSTISQLGFMFIAVGAGAYWAGVFHLLTHACFKACLFLGSGSVILACHHEQDMRRMGGLGSRMPMTRRTYAWACFAIAGFPPAAGFCSKDEILARAFALPGVGAAIWAVGLAAAALTAFYVYRSYYLTFAGAYRGNALPLVDPYPADTARARLLLTPAPVRGPTPEMLEALLAHGVAVPGRGEEDAHAPGHHQPEPGAALAAHAHAHAHAHAQDGEPHESPRSMTVPLLILGMASLGIGLVVGFPSVLSGGAAPVLLERWLEPVFAPAAAAAPPAEPSALAAKLLALASVTAALAGWAVARALYRDGPRAPDALLAHPGLRRVHRLIYNKYFVDEAYALVFVRGLGHVWRGLAAFDARVIDGAVDLAARLGRIAAYIQGAVDKYLVDGAVNAVGALVMAAGERVRRLQTGQLRAYLLGAVGGAVLAVLLVAALSG